MVITYEEFFISTCVVLLGLLFGSFVTMASYRIPLGQEIILRRSHCTSCNHNLFFRDLIPVFSWLLHQGKCAYCGAMVSKRYPMIEASLCFLFVIIYSIFGITPMTGVLWLITACLMMIIVTDFEHYIIPDKVYIALLPLAFLYNSLNHLSLLTVAAGGIIGLATGILLRWSMWLWKKQEGLGLGDVKFLGIIGCFIGPAFIAPFLFLSGLLGMVTALLWHLLGKGKLFPFGPALAASLFICLLIPQGSLPYEYLHSLVIEFFPRNQ